MRGLQWASGGSPADAGVRPPSASDSAEVRRDNITVQPDLSPDSISSRDLSPLPWIVAFIEGFSTLAVEVIAIRLAIPVVGSSMTLTGVMLGVVLFALSAGYWRGGALSARWDPARTRLALARNLLLAAVLYGAVAFPLEAVLLGKLLDAGLSLPLAIGATASLLFLAPIYLASQTVPMLAELTNADGKAGKASGKVLFYSTLGSVAGGIVTPVWLFPSMGVARSSFVVCGILAIAAGTMAIGRLRTAKALGFGTAAFAAILSANAFAAPGDALYSFDSAYQSIRIIEDTRGDGRLERVMEMGGGRASGIYVDTGETSFAYALAVNKALIESGADSVLVIGAAGFCFPRDAAQLASVRHVDAIDVDPVIREIAEKHFLKAPLAPKIRFLPLSARYAVRKLHDDGNRYGFTLVDAFIGQGIPEELVTVEFFRDVASLSKHTAANVIMDRSIESAFAKNLLAAFREANGEAWVQDARPGDSELTNILVTSWPVAGSVAWTGSGNAYRDDRNSADRDHVQLVWNNNAD